MNDQALTNTNTAVTPWASRQDVRELEERLRTMMPGASKLNALELFGLAQAAIAHGLDPFNGEIWCIPGKGLMAGIKGHRRAAHRQINEEAGGGGNYYVEFFLLNPDEMAAFKIPPKSLAFRARLHDSQTTRAYVDSIERMLKAGMPWEVVSKIMGERPFTEGIGYYIDGEQTRMTPVQVAQKRAEAETLKRRFDLPFTVMIGVNGDADETTAGEQFTVEHQEESPELREAKIQAGKAASATLRGDAGDIDLGPTWPAQDAACPEPQAPPAQPTPTTQPPKENKKTAQTFGAQLLFGIVRKYKLVGGNKEVLGALGKSGYITPADPDDIIMAWYERYHAYRANGDQPDVAAKEADEYVRASLESAAESAA